MVSRAREALGICQDQGYSKAMAFLGLGTSRDNLTIPEII